MYAKERWEKLSEDGKEFLNHKEAKREYSQRKDLNAFVLLDKIFPRKSDIIVAAEHDKIWLAVGEDEANTMTDEQILELIRCGVFCDGDGLCMFV